MYVYHFPFPGHEEENNHSVVQEERFENHSVEPVSKKRKVENDSDIHKGTPLLSELESRCEPYQEHYGTVTFLAITM